MVRVVILVHCEVVMHPPFGRSLVQAALSDHLPALEPLLAEVTRLHVLASFNFVSAAGGWALLGSRTASSSCGRSTGSASDLPAVGSLG